MKAFFISIAVVLSIATEAIGSDEVSFNETKRIELHWTSGDDQNRKVYKGYISLIFDESNYIVQISNTPFPDPLSPFQEKEEKLPSSGYSSYKMDRVDIYAWQGALDSLKKGKSDFFTTLHTGQLTTLKVIYIYEDKKSTQESYQLTGGAVFIHRFIDKVRKYNQSELDNPSAAARNTRTP